MHLIIFSDYALDPLGNPHPDLQGEHPQIHSHAFEHGVHKLTNVNIATHHTIHERPPEIPRAVTADGKKFKVRRIFVKKFFGFYFEFFQFSGKFMVEREGSMKFIVAVLFKICILKLFWISNIK